MASKSVVAASPIDLKELYDLFAWNPPRLVLFPHMDNKEPSTSTRKVAFFDRHFSTKLTLKRVVRLPSLVQDLAKTVDSALDAAKHTLPKISNGDLYTADQRRRAVREADRNVRDEKGVSMFYASTTARFCPAVASTLALHPAALSWISLIYWTTSVSSPRHAITDAELTFYRLDDTDDAVRREEIIDTMESRRRDILKAMREKQSPLMTYEFESLSACPVEVMTAIPELGDFEWAYCGSPEHPCGDPQHDKAKDQVAVIAPGPDALRPLWNIRVCSFIASSTMLIVLFIGFRGGNSSKPTNYASITISFTRGAWDFVRSRASWCQETKKKTGLRYEREAPKNGC